MLEELSSAGTERGVLSCILWHPEFMVEATAKLTVDDFVNPANRAIFACMSYLCRNGVAIDALQIMAHAEKNPSLLKAINDVGGIEYIESVRKFGKDSDEETLNTNITELRKYTLRRQMYDAADKIKAKMTHPETAHLSSDEISGYVEGLIQDITAGADTSSKVIDVGATVLSFVDNLVPHESTIGIPTGFPMFDGMTLGLENSCLYVFAARPKTGKSMLLKTITVNVANAGHPVLYVDTEMTTEQQMCRMLSQISQVPEIMIRSGRFKNDPIMREKVYWAADYMQKLKIYHVPMPHFEPKQLEHLVKLYQLRHGIELFCMDYIKIPDIGELQNVKEHQYLGHLVTSLHNIAMDCDIPIISAAQTKQTDFRAIADSDRILRYANVITFIENIPEEEILSGGGKEVTGNMRLVITANRSGPAHDDGQGIPLMAFKEYTTIYELGSLAR